MKLTPEEWDRGVDGTIDWIDVRRQEKCPVWGSHAEEALIELGFRDEGNFWGTYVHLQQPPSRWGIQPERLERCLWQRLLETGEVGPHPLNVIDVPDYEAVDLYEQVFKCVPSLPLPTNAIPHSSDPLLACASGDFATILGSCGSTTSSLPCTRTS